MTDPTSIVLADIEVIIVAEFETSVTKFAIAFVLGLLAQLEMATQIHVSVFFILVQLE